MPIDAPRELAAPDEICSFADREPLDRGIWVSGTGSPSIVNNDIEVDSIGISLAKGNEAKVYSNTVCGGDGSIVILDGATPEIGDNETCD